MKDKFADIPFMSSVQSLSFFLCLCWVSLTVSVCEPETISSFVMCTKPDWFADYVKLVRDNGRRIYHVLKIFHDLIMIVRILKLYVIGK